MRRRMLALAAGAMATMGMQAPTPPPAAGPPEIALWRLDCGDARIGDLDTFSDTHAYVGRSKTLTDSCYLIRHGDRYLLWDTGFPGALAGSTTGDDSFRITVRTRIVDQLARIGVRPEQVTFVGISHYHDDHTGQAADFPRATLLIGTADWEVIRGRPASAARFAPWVEGQSRVAPQAGDHDVFGDGSVVMLNMPGHTPGHHSLLVRLPRTGPVMLTGDLYHFTENFESGGVPGFNTNRADTLASMARFREMARNLRARIVIQHEPGDIAKLPAFPEPAR